jgi:hypothetical protein
MSQPKTILRTIDDREEIWYSDEYIKEQIELAFQAGIAIGLRIEIHFLQPLSDDVIPDYTNKFWEKINEEYSRNFNKGHVWKTVGKRTIK